MANIPSRPVVRKAPNRQRLIADDGRTIVRLYHNDSDSTTTLISCRDAGMPCAEHDGQPCNWERRVAWHTRTQGLDEG